MLALAAALTAASASADGDPASDVLAAQSLFLPQDAAVPVREQSRLVGLLGESERAGYPIRVALIASPTDLGSVTALWRQPQLYARFLEQELSLVYHGPLLVVMPDGIGSYHARPGAVTPGTDLAAVAMAAVMRLAAAAGHVLQVPSATASTSNSSDAIPWIALAIGAALVAAAWAVSVRARPLRA
jgi:hypothetical protein